MILVLHKHAVVAGASISMQAVLADWSLCNVILKSIVGSRVLDIDCSFVLQLPHLYHGLLSCSKPGSDVDLSISKWLQARVS